MGGRITRNASTPSLNDLFEQSFVTAADGNPALAVTNTDGSAVGGGGGGGSETQYADGASAATPTGNQVNWNNGGTQASVATNKPLPAQLRNSSGTEIATASNPARIDPTGTTTQPISASSLPLPTGAATSAKQPALGTAGSASTDVITVQGISSMTPVKTDGSGVTQPVSGTVTANAGTNLNTSLLALESGGNLASVASVEGATSDAAVTSDVNGTVSAKLRGLVKILADIWDSVNHRIKVDGSGVTQPVSGTVTANAGSGTFTIQANATVNEAQINGVTPLMGNGVTGTGSQRVTIASDNSAISGLGIGATSSSVPANAVLNGMNIAGNLVGMTGFSAGADGVSNSITALGTFAFKYSYNGTTWDRVRSAKDALNSAGAGLPTAQIVAQFDDTSPTAITENQFGNIRMSSNRNLYGTVRDAAGNERGANVTAANELLVNVNNATLAAIQSGTWTVQPGNTANTTPWLVTPTPSTAGGWTPSLKNGLSTTVSAVKSSAAGALGGWYIFNPNTSTAYVQIFDVATAGGVTLGTTVPKLSLGIPAGGGANMPICDNGISFANGIQLAATTTATGSTAPSTALDCNFWYK